MIKFPILIMSPTKVPLLLSEGRTVVKCICEYNQSGRGAVFDPEPAFATSTTFCECIFAA